MIEPKTLSIAINLTIDGTAQRTILRGILRYSRTRLHWRFVENAGQPWIKAAALRHLKVDGVLTSINDQEDLAAIKALRVPVVGLTQTLECPGIPRVISDDLLIGAMGARHFLQKGFRHLAFYGAQGMIWSQRRRESFAQQVREAGWEIHEMELPHTHSLKRTLHSLSRWLVELPKPVAVMCCDDRMGRQVLTAARQAGLDVPTMVAVLGVDNDDLICDLADPPLSSIVQDADRIGYEAAAMLDLMMEGGKPSPMHQQIAPLEVVQRRSTDQLAIEDLEVAGIIAQIRKLVGQPLSVKELLANLPMSRRTLERRFLLAVGQRPAEVIRSIHLERAMYLLRSSQLSVAQIATQAGFGDARALSVVFRRELQVSPGDYRKRFTDGS